MSGCDTMMVARTAQPARTEGRDVANLSNDCEVAVVGAGPYGLAVAAHLRSAKVDARVFGRPMSFWREQMPKGMKLRSPWIATHIADPGKRLSLDVFAHQVALAPQDQLPLERFVQYGDWFARQAVPDLDARKVLRIENAAPGFRLVLEDGEVAARRVVVALGLAGQELRPPQFVGLEPDLVSHTCEHDRLDRWRGRRVAVVGRGQSACESAALLRESGSEVDLIARGEVHWIGVAPGKADRDRGWRWRLRELMQAPSAVGPFPWSWLNELPGIERLLPRDLRSWIAARSLRAAATRWVMPGFEGVRVLAGRTISSVSRQGDGVAVALDDGVRTYDHVLLGTGYRIDIAKLGILSPELLGTVARNGGSPVLSAGFESSRPGLHFAGASAVDSYGPLMRFIAGAGYAARSITRTALAGRGRAKPAERDSHNGYAVRSAQRMSQL
jgi:pyridine nucleotide-disulfide oxidoreductase